MRYVAQEKLMFVILTLRIIREMIMLKILLGVMASKAA